MIAFIICLFAFVKLFFAGRKSLSGGVSLAFAFGYMYGIIRAHYPDRPHTLSSTRPWLDFTWRYSRASARSSAPKNAADRALGDGDVSLAGGARAAAAAGPLIQLVGLRGQVFFLPFLVIGAMFENPDSGAGVLADGAKYRRLRICRR